VVRSVHNNNNTEKIILSYLIFLVILNIKVTGDFLIICTMLSIFQAETLKFNNNLSLLTPLFSTSLACVCFRYQFIYLAIILKSFFSLKCRYVGRVCVSPFLRVFNRVFRLNFH
jgi:hypothetical protein